MKAFAIALNDETSALAYITCARSSERVKNDFAVKKFKAYTPKETDLELKRFKIKWNYPWNEAEVDFQTGLVKRPYVTKNPRARIACALSHYNLWALCAQSDEPFLILEQDAMFIRKLKYADILTSNFGVVGINDPIGATRKAAQLDAMIQHDQREIQPIPPLDQITTPQGLAGNSAYIIKPWAAKKLIEGVKEYGLWPNDAFMCKQLFSFLGLTRTYYTRVQGLISTTSN